MEKEFPWGTEEACFAVGSGVGFQVSGFRGQVFPEPDTRNLAPGTCPGGCHYERERSDCQSSRKTATISYRMSEPRFPPVSAEPYVTGPAPLSCPRQTRRGEQSLTAVVFDLDGVVYRGRTALPGARKTISWLRQRGLKVFFLTNNSTLTRAEYIHRLGRFGIPCKMEMIYSSAYACALYLQENGGRHPCALVVGEGGLAGELRRAGIEVVRKLTRKKVDYVVVGMDRKINYRKLADAQSAIFRGARFIASNRDPVYPVEKGLIPGGGTIVAAIQTASQKKPLVIGKPSPYILKVLLRKEKLDPKRVLLLGDRLDTDVASGRRAGVLTAIALTGVTSREEIARAPARLRPHWVIQSIADLPGLITKGGAS